MNKEEFIGKLQMVYVGDRNAFNEIVEDNQKLKNEVVYSKVEIDRLNNLIKSQDRKIKLAIKIFENINKIYGESSSINDVIGVLKENNNE